MSSPLPDASGLFERYFLASYKEEQLARRARLLAHRGRPSSPFDDPGRARIRRQLEGMAEAARQDWGQFLGESKQLDAVWLAAFEAHWDAGRVAWLLERAKPENASNDYVILCCELGAALGALLRDAVPGLSWVEELPYWESVLVDERGAVHEVFRWARERLSSTGVEQPLVEVVERIARARSG